MTNPRKMADWEIKNEMEGLLFQMETSVHRRHDVPELFKVQMARFNALDDERAAR